MQIIEKAVKDLIPYTKNPRKNDKAVDAVAASIREFGFKVPVVIDAKGVIVAGHTRLKAAKKLHIDKVPCVVADDLSPEQVKAFRLADNKVGEAAAWDFDLLGEELEGLADFDLDMSEFGFELPGLDADIYEDDFDVASAIPDEPVTKLGNIWALGRHRLLCGDCTDITLVEELLGEHRADMYLTDPPYGVDYTGKTKDALKIDNDALRGDGLKDLLLGAFYAADHVMKPGAAFYIWHADSHGLIFREACVDVGWQVRQCLIWNKNVMVMGRQDYHWKHEPCLYGWKEGAAHLWAADRKQTTILDFDRPSRSAEHPTMKPIMLFDYQIQNNTKGEDIVFDGFSGSGTTLIACEQNGRTAYCMELDPKYCDVIVKRWETLKGRIGKGMIKWGENRQK
jgi:DNA modification methylase